MLGSGFVHLVLGSYGARGGGGGGGGYVISSMAEQIIDTPQAPRDN